MRSGRAAATVACGVLLLAVGWGAWVLGANRLTAMAALQHRANPARVDEGRAPAPAPFLLAAQGRVEPVSGDLQLAIGLIGTLKAVYVDEGETIKKGELLAELDNDDQRARVAEAEAQVRLRKAELDKLLHGARPEERREAAAQLQRTEASVALAKLEVARQQPLAAKGVASQQALDQAVSSLQVAEANADVNKAASDLINAPPRTEDVAIAQANLGLAEATLNEQRALLEKTQLHSPIDGIVLRRYLKTGETVSIQPLIPILQVGNMRQLRVRAEVDETDVGQLELGQRVSVAAPAYAHQRFSGEVERIGQSMGRKTVRSDEPTEKTDTNVLDVLIKLDDPRVRLPNGLRVNVFVEQSHATSK